MQPASPQDCACRHVAEPFVDQPLPDHVCLDAMAASVAAATRDGLIPVQHWWPVQMSNGGALGLVLRQWVQEPPNATLAAQLDKDRGFQTERSSLERLMDERGHSGDSGMDRRIAERLRRRGLPDTPATVRYLREGSVDGSSVLPARGLLVTTYAYVRVFQPPAGARTAGEFHPPHEVAVTGLLELATAELWDKVRAVTNAHRDWLGHHRCWEFARIHGVNYYPLADPRAKSRAHPAATRIAVDADAKRFDPCDYLDEAMRGLDGLLSLLDQTHPDRRADILTRYLKHVKDRVCQRRQRKKMPITPQPGWQNRFRHIVTRALSDQ